MGNCRSSAAAETEGGLVAASERDAAPLPNELTETPARPLAIVLRHGGEGLADDADGWQQRADTSEFWRESANASMSSCPMGPRNGTNMYESPLVLGRNASTYPAMDDGASPKHSFAPSGLFYGEDDHQPTPPLAILHTHGGLKPVHPFYPPDTAAQNQRDGDSVCSQDSGSGPLSADRTMTFRSASASTGHFEAVRSWLVTIDSSSDMISSERTDSQYDVAFTDPAAAPR